MFKLKSLVAATFGLRSLEQEKEGIKMLKLKSLVLLVVVGVCILAVSVFSAVPLRINYQGRYSENGTPVIGSRYFVFKIVENSGGGEVYWTSGSVSINLQNGLFNYVLEPTGVDWPNVEPYFEVWAGPSAGNETMLSPRERINASAYAIYTSSAGYAFNALQSNVNSTLQSGVTLFINGEISTTGEAVTISTNVVVEGKVSILETGGTPAYYSILQGGDQTGNINYTLPTSSGSSGNILTTDSSGNLSWTSAGAGDVTAASNITDNRIVRGDGGAKGVQESLVTIDDTGHVLPNSDSAQDLGTSTTYWANIYTDRLYLNTTGYLDGTKWAEYGYIALSGGGFAPETDSVSELGGSGNYWVKTYTDRLYLNSTAYLDGAAAGNINGVGNLQMGTAFSGTSQAVLEANASVAGVTYPLMARNIRHAADALSAVGLKLQLGGADTAAELYKWAGIVAQATSTWEAQVNLDIYTKNTASADATAKWRFSYDGMLHPITDSASDLGTTALYVRYIYGDRYYLNSTAYLDGATPGVAALTGKVGIGTATVPHGEVGAVKFAIEGVNASASGPHTAWTTDADDYPLLYFLPYAHDVISINFDMFWDSTTGWRSSDAGSNFQIEKYADKVRFDYDKDIAVGGVVARHNLMTLDFSTTTAVVGVSTNLALAATQKLLLDGIAGTGDTYITESSANTVDIVTAGTYHTKLSSTGDFSVYAAGVGGGIVVYENNVAWPTFSAYSDRNTGMYFPAVDTLGLVVGGTEKFRVDASGISANSRKLIDIYDYAVCITTPAALGTVMTLISPFRGYAVTITNITARIIGGTNVVFMIAQKSTDLITSTNIWTANVTANTTSWTGGTANDFTVPADYALFLLPVSVSGNVDRLMIKYRITKD